MSVDITSLVISVRSDGIKEASNALSGLSTSANNAEKRVSALTSAMTKLNDVNKLSSVAADAFMVKLREQSALMQSLSNNSRTAAGGTQALAAAMTLLSSSLNILVQQQTRADVQQRLHNNSMSEGRALARGLAGSLGALWMTYSSFAGMAVGIAIGASLKGIITVGKDVEATLEAIRVKGIETVDSINKIRDSVMELGKGVYGPQVVAKAFETLILAGLNAKQALMGISDALNLATVGGTSIEKSAYVLVQVGTALGYTAENYGRIADVIAMTAAVSMSSVESLSEAFKSGSSVGKLYGVTLVDIGTSLAALSNLGIQGSAAGTSLKNFYKELASSSEKVKSTLKGMKLVPEDFKDAQGNYLGVLQVVEKLAQGMDNLTEAQGKIAIANLSNERGMKTAIELLDLYRQKVGDATGSGKDHANMLSSLRQKIEESYGFAAIGAAQMSLTVEAQFKSVANTLDTVFMEAFRKVSPEVSLVASRLKSAFNSPEFIQAIQSIAIGVANITVALVENIPLVMQFVAAVIAAKAFTFIVGVFEAITVALRGIAAGAAVANIALGPLAVALLAAGAAYMYFTRERDNSNLSTSQKTAIKYSEDYADALDKEAERLRTQLGLMREGKTARDAETQSMYAQQLAMAKLQGDKAKSEAENRLEKAGMGLTIAEISTSESVVKRGGMMTGRVKEFKEAQASLAEVNSKVDASYKRTVEGQKAIMQASKELEQERVKQEDADRLKRQSKGTGVLAEKPDTAGINDTYSTRLTTIRGEIEAGKRELQSIESSANSRFKAGLISEFDQIDAISDARIKKLTNDVSKFQAMINTAAPKNRGNVTALVKNEMTAAEDRLSDEKNRREEAYSVVYARMQEENYANHYKQLTLQGRNEEAAVEKSKRLYESKLENEKVTLLDSLQQLSVATGPQADELQRKVAALAQHISYMQSETDALISKGKLDDSELATQKMMDKFKIKVAEINANVPNGGLTAGIMADAEIESLRTQQIPLLEELLKVQKALAEAPNAGPDAIKTFAKTQATLEELKKKTGSRTAWEGAQQSLRDYAKEASDDGALIGGAMTNAFKSAEDALVNFVMTGKLNFKSFANSVIADLVRIQTKQMLSGMFGMGAKGGSGGMGMMGSFGSMAAGAQGLMEGYGSFAMMNAGVAASQGLSIADLAGAFADGGDPPVGQVSLVGERGPELFVPKTAGTIIPNHMLNASSPTQQASSSSNDRPMQYTIVNQTTGRIDSVKEQRLSDDERALIISEAVNATASSLYDTNSRMSKGMRNTHDVQRKR